MFSIGKTAKILNISTDTLRHYDRMGLIPPAHKDPQSGYRFYDIDQFHLIDRIRYLQTLDFSLTEIKEIMENGKAEFLLPLLNQKGLEYKNEKKALQKKIDIAQWYINYFLFGQEDGDPQEMYIKQIEERYVIWSDCKDVFSLIGTDLELTRIRNFPEFKQMRVLRQWGCFIDYDKMIKGEFSAYKSLMYLMDKPLIDSPHLMILHAGEYLCFRAKAYMNDFGDTGKIADFFKNNNYKPGLIIANEHEGDLLEFSESVFEIQIQLIKE